MGEVLYRVHSEDAVESKAEGAVKICTHYNDCADPGSIVKRILPGDSNFKTSRTTSYMLPPWNLMSSTENDA